MRVGILMRLARYEDLTSSGLFRPSPSDSSSLQQSSTEDVEFKLIDPCKPYSRDDSYDILLHKVTALE